MISAGSGARRSLASRRQTSATCYDESHALTSSRKAAGAHGLGCTPISPGSAGFAAKAVRSPRHPENRLSVSVSLPDTYNALNVQAIKYPIRMQIHGYSKSLQPGCQIPRTLNYDNALKIGPIAAFDHCGVISQTVRRGNGRRDQSYP